MPERPEVARRINRDLYREFLDLDPDTANEGIFHKVWGDANEMASVAELTWNVTRPRLSVVSIELSGEFCGAYCEDFNIHYNYDLRNGERLRYDSLFTATGRVEVTDSLSWGWRSIMQTQIDKLSYELATADTASIEADTLRNAIALYTTCLEEHATPYMEDLIVQREAMTFRMSRCSNHAERALDELDAVELDLDYTWLSPRFHGSVVPLFAH